MDILEALKTERTRIQARLNALNTAIGALKGSAALPATRNGATPTRRKMSAKGRAAIAKASRERWAKYRAAKKKK